MQNDYILSGKRRIVERWGHSSLYERTRHEVAATGVGLPEYAPLGAACLSSSRAPLLLVVPWESLSSQGWLNEDDHDLVVESVNAYLASKR